MSRHTLRSLALALPFIFATACGGAQKHAETPDFTEKGWSGTSSDADQAKGDPQIQSGGAKSDDAAKSAPPPPADKSPMAPAPDKPETTSTAEADVVAGAALPKPPPAPKAAKPVKAKKPNKTRKKTAKAT